VATTESSAKNKYRFYLCSNPNCTLRFPAPIDPVSDSLPCPRCKSPTRPIPTPDDVSVHNPRQERIQGYTPLEVLLDNIRSTFNVGAMLRTADGAGVNHVHLTGITPQPTNPRIAKVSLGAEFAVPWTYHPNGLSAVQEFKNRGLRILGLEILPGASSLFDLTADTLSVPTLLVVGNEVSGIDPDIQALCDQYIWIPMQGYKRSLNVAVAFGITIYTLRYGLPAVISDKIA
jgi:tRNA G18 (ribose-2'-O)-methylase SpoU